MHDFKYLNGSLHCEGVSVESLVRKFGSPLYVYSQSTLEDHFSRLDEAFAAVDRTVSFAVKSNSNLAVLRTLADQGSGFDIVSGGELKRVIAAGGDPRRCVFAGVGKSEEEIRFALRKKIYCFNVESEPELVRIDRIAGRLKVKAPIAIRVNPNVDAKTHAKITTGTYQNKFGIAFEEIESLYRRAARLKNLRIRGIQMHIGSQLTQVRPFEEAVAKMVPLVASLKEQFGLEFFSIGGGIGIVYDPALESGRAGWWKSPEGKKILTAHEYAARLLPLLQPLGLKILLEPGRSISGNAGILVTRVEYVKRTGQKNFVIVDAAMNDLIRPAFYDAYHQIVPLKRKGGAKTPSDVVGPICESGDYFCKDRPLPRVAEGDHLALLSAGAYAFAMASTYNSRPLAAEVLVKGNRSELVRRRQKTEDIWREESLPKWMKK